MRPPARPAVAVFLVCLFFYLLMAYGGVRSADGENIFWLARSLAQDGSFAIENQFPTWPDFMLARGVDGRYYSTFAPGQAILMAPLVQLAGWVNQTGWYHRFPPAVSFINAEAVKTFVYHLPLRNPRPHALRMITALFNLVITAFLVMVFYALTVRLTASVAAGMVNSLLLGLATPLWSYSATFFKEPLTMTWVLLSFFVLAGNDPRLTGQGPRHWRLPAAGALAGLALATHITAVLFAPFLMLYALLPYWLTKERPGRKWRFCLLAAGWFALGFLLPAGALAGYNDYRFGDIFETGRTVLSEPTIQHGAWVWPWPGLAGLLISAHKGFFWFCPLVLAGLYQWPKLYRRHRFLALWLMGVVVFRIGFLACRSDWHGGFCLGPRHLLPLVPFLLIPLGYALARFFQSRSVIKKRQVAGGLLLTWICFGQQLYFVLGEPISYYYILKHYFLTRGLAIIDSSDIYFQWANTPLVYLLEAKRGPFLWQNADWTNYQIWAWGMGLSALLLAGGGFYFWQGRLGRPPKRRT